GDPRYETAFARVQVGGAAQLKLVQVSADPVVVRLADANGFVYSGARITASVSVGGTVSPAVLATDGEGLAAFSWTPGSAPANELRLGVELVPAVSLILRAGVAVPAIRMVVNAASFVPGIAAGALETILGANLSGGRVS